MVDGASTLVPSPLAPLEGTGRATESDIGESCVGAGRWPRLRVGRALTYADALTERRATEWMADAERCPDV